MAEYNGHKNWTHWNVSLWIGNDESLYRLACEHVKRARRDRCGMPRPAERAATIAARRMLADLPARTPDGARYSMTAVRAAMVGLES